MIRTRIDAGVAFIAFDRPPVNALDRELVRELLLAIDTAQNDPDVVGLVLHGANGTFSAGAEIRGFEDRSRVASSGDVTLLDVIAALDRGPKRAYAAIEGVALGGGYEIVLACDGIYAAPAARVGLPEVKLGLLPGAGGTQRLPRLAGVRNALDIMTTGRLVGAAEAYGLGLIDGILVDDVVTECGAIARREARLSRRRVSALAVAPDDEALATVRAGLPARDRGGDAAHAIAGLVETAVAGTAFDAGLAAERAAFETLVASPESAAKRWVFFAEREAAKVPGVDRGVAVPPVQRIAVVGAGTMGSGIAMALANAGIAVDLIEREPGALARAEATVLRTYAASVAKGRIRDDDATARTGRIAYHDTPAAAARADIVIEAVFEEIGIKQAVFAELDRICPPGTLLATNTSTLDIDAIAAATARPADVIGLHFFSPANVMRLLEIVRGRQTADWAIASAFALARRIGKVGVLAQSCDGFIGNRMLAGYAREAGRLLLEGALPQDVDRAIAGFGFPMGPFAMGDLAGLDVGWRIRKGRVAAGAPPGDPTIADRLCERGRFGQKTGAGYYRYDAGSRTPQPDAAVEALILAESERLGLSRRAIPDDEIVTRCLLPLVDEGARILADGTALRPGDIDTVWINGYGFPASRGGPMHWADSVGLPAIVATMTELEARTGGARSPAPLLDELARRGGRFADLQGRPTAAMRTHGSLV